MTETSKNATDPGQSGKTSPDEQVLLDFPDFNDIPSEKKSQQVTSDLLDYPDLNFKTEPRASTQVQVDAAPQQMVYEHTEEAYRYAQEAHVGFADDEEPEEEFPEEKPKLSFREILAIPLPTAIQRRAYMQYFAAVGVALFCIFMAIFNRDLRYLMGIAISVALVYLGISTTLDYANGKIVEMAVLCANVNESRLKKNTIVVFRTNEDIPKYFEFVVPGKHGHKFQLNAVYIIYFDPTKKNVLLGYIEA